MSKTNGFNVRKIKNKIFVSSGLGKHYSIFLLEKEISRNFELLKKGIYHVFLVMNGLDVIDIDVDMNKYGENLNQELEYVKVGEVYHEHYS